MRAKIGARSGCCSIDQLTAVTIRTQIIVAMVLLFNVALASAAPGQMPDKVLFVGNSFTYYNNGLHMHYGNLLRAAGLHRSGQSKLRMLTFSGSGLWEHAAGLQSAVVNDPWQAVVMHDYSNGPLKRWQRFVEASDELSRIAREHDVEPILMMTWAYADDPEMTQGLATAYTKRGAELGARVIPIGLAFAAVTQNTSVDLYSPDLLGYDNGKPVYQQTVKHPSLAGTYLAACTVFAVLTGQSPVGLRYTAGLDEKIASALQRAADQTVTRYQQR